MPPRLRPDGAGNFRDPSGRVVTLKGINLDGASKLPVQPEIPTYRRVSPELFFNADDVSFRGRPFALSEAHEHLARIRQWGFNTVRYLVTWEALEHSGPGKYDEEFIDFTIEMLKIIDSYGLYIVMDPHQDVWSRLTGGSGAPLWTLYAAGLNPMNIPATESAIVHNFIAEEAQYPSMVWATNYSRFCSQLMFTLFFAGEYFAPKAELNGENIQHFLQRHFIAAFSHLYSRIASETSLVTSGTLLGVESLNEPNAGLIGCLNLADPSPDKLKTGTAPTPFQSMLLASGVACEVDVYEFTSFGPRKSGTRTVDPQGASMWLRKHEFDDEAHYGWRRAPQWRYGECLWAQNGVWDVKTRKLLRNDYFRYMNGTQCDATFFGNVFFRTFWDKFKAETRQCLSADVTLFCQFPVLSVPPDFAGTPSLDENCAACLHYYDGMTLVTKKWNSWFNIDTLGVLRGKYLTPAMGIVFGEKAIRNSFRDQMKTMRQECAERMGSVPVLMSETGMPFDLSGGKAYRTGDFSSQVKALDALSFGLDGSCLSHTYWTYAHLNSHKHGDQWNCEDFSFWSPADTAAGRGATVAFPKADSADGSAGGAAEPLLDSLDGDFGADGTRAAPATIRPYPRLIRGVPETFSFDLRTSEFHVVVVGDTEAGWETEEPTEIFLPRYHYNFETVEVNVSAGQWQLRPQEQKLLWWHPAGRQELRAVCPEGSNSGAGAGMSRGISGGVCTTGSCVIA